jgi:hypothetical protein
VEIDEFVKYKYREKMGCLEHLDHKKEIFYNCMA